MANVPEGGEGPGKITAFTAGGGIRRAGGFSGGWSFGGLREAQSPLRNGRNPFGANIIAFNKSLCAGEIEKTITLPADAQYG